MKEKHHTARNITTRLTFRVSVSLSWTIKRTLETDVRGEEPLKFFTSSNKARATRPAGNCRYPVPSAGNAMLVKPSVEAIVSTVLTNWRRTWT